MTQKLLDLCEKYLLYCLRSGSMRADIHNEICDEILKIKFPDLSPDSFEWTHTHHDLHINSQHVTGQLNTSIGYPLDLIQRGTYDIFVTEREWEKAARRFAGKLKEKLLQVRVKTP